MGSLGSQAAVATQSKSCRPRSEAVGAWIRKGSQSLVGSGQNRQALTPCRGSAGHRLRGPADDAPVGLRVGGAFAADDQDASLIIELQRSLQATVERRGQ